MFGNFSVIGHPSGTSADIEDTMHFAVQSGVRARTEEKPLAEAAGPMPPWTRDGPATAWC